MYSQIQIGKFSNIKFLTFTHNFSQEQSQEGIKNQYIVLGIFFHWKSKAKKKKKHLKDFL